jgi:hypothetical protein
VFAQLVLARIIEPVSKLDSPRVLEEAGATAASYRTVTRRLRAYATDTWRNKRPQVETRVLEVDTPAGLESLLHRDMARCRRCTLTPAAGRH